MNANPAARSLSVVEVPDGCGNAPRKVTLRDFAVALYGGDFDGVTGQLSDHAQWMLVGSRSLSGLGEISEWLSAESAAVELRISTIITHGRDCGIDGTVRYADGTQVAFCHVVIFAGTANTAKIKEIRSYTLPLILARS